MTNRRSFKSAVYLDKAYVENLIGMAINNMRDSKNIDGSHTYLYHNFSSVMNFIDKYHNIKIVRSSDSNVVGLTDNRRANESYKLFTSIYKKSAERYKSTGRNNYTFECKEKLGQILLKAVEDLLRTKY